MKQDGFALIIILFIIFLAIVIAFLKYCLREITDSNDQSVENSNPNNITTNNQQLRNINIVMYPNQNNGNHCSRGYLHNNINQSHVISPHVPTESAINLHEVEIATDCKKYIKSESIYVPD